MEKIGVGIVTYESEPYLKKLYDSLPLNKIDELVIVNGGDSYTENYKEANWIQHKNNYYPAVCRNDAVNFLLQRDCEHIFLIEDDMIIKKDDIFKKYIELSKKSGINYLCFTSTSWGSGEPGERTPKLKVDYTENLSLSLYPNMCNEFTYHHRSCFEKIGLYDTNFRDPFDIDMAYRESQEKYSTPFWWFADLSNADEYIMNNPEAVSRLQDENREDGSRTKRIEEQWKMFYKKHGIYVHQIPQKNKEEVITFLKKRKKYAKGYK